MGFRTPSLETVLTGGIIGNKGQFSPLGFFGGPAAASFITHPKSPQAPALPLTPPSAHPATLDSAQVALAGKSEQQGARSAEGAGFDNTIQTSGQGVLQQPQTTKTTLLGG